MQKISDWLRELGLSEYADRFVKNRIDFRVLPDLTEQDLEKLGVCSVIAASENKRLTVFRLGVSQLLLGLLGAADIEHRV
jgi:SAM domain (Sterile alpha motif)